MLVTGKRHPQPVLSDYGISSYGSRSNRHALNSAAATTPTGSAALTAPMSAAFSDPQPPKIPIAKFGSLSQIILPVLTAFHVRRRPAGRAGTLPANPQLLAATAGPDC
jgi:hypothetical protein